MKSDLPKVLFPVCGISMLMRVVDILRVSGITDIAVIYGYRGELVQEELSKTNNIHMFEQKEQLGTGHALMQVDLDRFNDEHVIIIPGDEPLFDPETIKAFINDTMNNNYDASILTAVFDDPTGYGRIIRNAKGTVERIVEHKDASESERAVKEVNTGVYCIKRTLLAKYLPKLSNNNSQKEFYLTDVFGLLHNDGLQTGAFTAQDPMESMGVNSRYQLMQANAYYKGRMLKRLMDNGVTINNPETVVIEGDVESENDVVIQSPAVFKGKVVLKKGSVVGPYVYLENVTVDGEKISFAAVTAAARRGISI